MYKSPIEIICAKVHEDILDKTEDYLMLKIKQKMEVKVDKDEMIKALKYDRDQYEKGYDDAKQKYEKMLDKLADFLESLQIDVPCDCLAPISDECETCHYNAPTKECWIKWAEKETEDDRK